MVNMNKKKKIVLISILIFIILIISHEIFYYSITKKLIKNLELMNISSKVITLSTSIIWGDAINHKITMEVSAKYLQKSDEEWYKYIYDFNYGISRFYNDNNTKSILDLIDSTASKCAKYYNLYGYTLFHSKRNKTIESLYDASLLLKELAESPTGNYTSFNKELNEQLNTISIAKEKLQINN